MPYELTGRDEEVMPVVFQQMAEGKSVSAICREHKWNRASINLWAYSKKWREQYREAQMALGAIQGEWVVDEAQKATEMKDYTRIQGLRLYVDSLKWAAARHNRLLYGDKVDVTSDGQRVGVIVLPAERASAPEGTEPEAEEPRSEADGTNIMGA